MNEVATRGQIRMGMARWLLVLVPLIVGLGSLMGYLSNSGYGNRWFAALDLPWFTPPGWVFGLVWPILYVMMAVALALVVTARGARCRGPAIAAFVVQYLLNLAWSPLFFGARQVSAALWLLIVIWVAALVMTLLFGRVRKTAAWLMVPYLAWLSFAALLNFTIDQRNPAAETLVPPAAQADIR